MLAVAAIWALSRKVISLPQVMIGIVFWLIAASPHLVLIIREATNSGDLPGTVRSVLFGKPFQERVLSTVLSGRLLLISAGFVLLNFPNLLLPAAALGFWQSVRRSPHAAVYWVLLVGLALHSLFAFRYPVPDQHLFFLSTYVFLCLFGGVGFARWIGDPPLTASRKKLHWTAWCLILVTPMLYALVPVLCRKIDTLGYVERNKPYRDDYVYLFVPWSFVERSAARLSKQAADMANESGVIIVEDGMAEFAVRYELDRRDLDGVEVHVPEIPPKVMEAAMEAGRKIVLVPRDADHPTTLPLRGEWKRHGDLYELVPTANGE